MSQADLDALRGIVTSSWLTRSSGYLTERPTTGELFHLHVGDLSADLRFQLPFDLANWPDRLTLLRDGWRIDQICQYRPLIYYAAFGSPEIFEQFAISVRSLIEFGHYQGPIVVLTDQTPEAPGRTSSPAEDLARVALLQFQPSDRPGFMAARYLILDWPDAWRFQPLLYVDTDTVFDRDVTPMLHADRQIGSHSGTDRAAVDTVGQPRVGRRRCCSAISARRASWPVSIPARWESRTSAHTPRRCG